MADDRRHIAVRAAESWQRISPPSSGSCCRCRLSRSIPARCCGRGRTGIARISVGKCRYSVPARLIGSAGPGRCCPRTSWRVFDGSRKAAVHPRLTAAGDEHLELDHYLEILVRKPGALPGSAALAQARAAGVFTSAHEAFWAAARARHGDGAGHQGADRGAAAAPADARRAGDRRDHRGAGRGDLLPGRGRGRGPQARRRGRPGRPGPGAGAGPRPARCRAGASVITLPRRRDAAARRTRARPRRWPPTTSCSPARAGKEARDGRAGVMS